MARKYNQHYAILSAIKRCFSRSPTHRAALVEALCPRKKGPRGGARYRCAACKKDFGVREVQVDHIEPVIPIGILSTTLTWDEIIKRLFCSVDNLQVLCTDCHKKKSKIENQRRKIK